MEYPKIETLFVRDEKTFKVTDQLRLPEFDLVKRWLVTEKIDGTNVRVFFDGANLGVPTVRFKGRTENAQMPTFLLTHLQDAFTAEKVGAAFDEGSSVILFGEGYGPKIQKGGNYRSDVSFRLFDVRVGEWWLNWDGVDDVADKLGIRTVPVLGRCDSLDRAIERLRHGSPVAFQEAENEIPQEGIVARTDPLLMTRGGDRLMWKLKAKDYA